MIKLRASLMMLAIGSASVLAQPAPPDTSGASKPGDATPQQAPAPKPGVPTAEAKAEAKAHYEKGITHYNLGEWDQAITEFRAAYELSSAPGLLFNIAQSFRLKKDFEQAAFFYKTYLRLKPDAPNRADVESQIQDMEKLIAEQKAQAAAPPTGTVNPETESGKGSAAAEKPVEKPAAPAQPTININVGRSDQKDQVEQGDKSLQTAGIATAGAGAAIVLTGVIFGTMASNAAKSLTALNNGGTWTQAEQDKYDAGKRDNTIAVICFVAGGAAVATGAALWGVGFLKNSHASVAAVPTKGGAAFAAGWQF